MKLAKRTHTAIPWGKILKAATATKKNGEPRYTITQMAQKFGYFNKDANDPNQEFRGILSRFRTIGARIDGKLTKLAKGTVRRGKGAAKVAPKAKAKVSAPKAKVVAKGKKTEPKESVAVGKAVVVLLHDSKKFISIRVPKAKVLVPVNDMLPQLIQVADGLGYAVVQKVVTPVVPETQPDVTQVTETPAVAVQTDMAPSNPDIAENEDATATTPDTQAAA